MRLLPALALLATMMAMRGSDAFPSSGQAQRRHSALARLQTQAAPLEPSALETALLWLGKDATPLNIVAVCDAADGARGWLGAALRGVRYLKLAALLKRDRAEYLLTAAFLAGRLDRADFPNLEGVPAGGTEATSGTASEELVPDCALPDKRYQDSPLDALLLWVFRGLVHKEINWSSPERGIAGLLQEGRHFMLSAEGADEESQHRFVRNVLAGLMTPALPPFYRVFMAGLVPSAEVSLT